MCCQPWRKSLPRLPNIVNDVPDGSLSTPPSPESPAAVDVSGHTTNGRPLCLITTQCAYGFQL
jgi:hypothetical protein